MIFIIFWFLLFLLLVLYTILYKIYQRFLKNRVSCKSLYMWFFIFNVFLVLCFFLFIKALLSQYESGSRRVYNQCIEKIKNV